MKKTTIIWLSMIVFISCTHRKQKNTYYEYKGFIAGTACIITYDKNAGNLDHEIQQMIREIDNSVVRENSSSLVSRINRNDSTGNADAHFIKLWQFSTQVYKQTEHAFDPTASPLDDFWGDDPAKFKNPAKADTAKIDSIRRLVSMENVSIAGNHTIVKKYASTTIDFKHVYKGYMVDQVADLLNSYNVANYRIDIGDRIRAKGVNEAGKKWQIGIDEPTDDVKSRQLLAIATLDNQAYATAGSYKHYCALGLMKLPYTIDPRTSQPVKHTLLYTAVMAASCAEADAYAAAFLVMGPEQTKVYINAHPDIQAYLVSTNYKGEWVTFISNGLKEKLELIRQENPI